MTKRILSVALVAALMLGLLAGCYRDRPLPAFEGAGDIPYPVGEFTINYASDDEVRRNSYVVCDVTLELDKDKTKIIKALDERRHRIRDIVICEISSRTYDELNTSELRNELKRNIMDRINDEFNNVVANVYFGVFHFHNGG